MRGPVVGCLPQSGVRPPAVRLVVRPFLPPKSVAEATRQRFLAGQAPAFSCPPTKIISLRKPNQPGHCPIPTRRQGGPCGRPPARLCVRRVRDGEPGTPPVPEGGGGPPPQPRGDPEPAPTLRITTRPNPPVARSTGAVRRFADVPWSTTASILQPLATGAMTRGIAECRRGVQERHAPRARGALGKRGVSPLVASKPDQRPPVEASRGSTLRSTSPRRHARRTSGRWWTPPPHGTLPPPPPGPTAGPRGDREGGGAGVLRVLS